MAVRNGPEVLTETERSRLDDRADETFYRTPRYVQHVDAAFRDRLRSLYATHLDPGDTVLDLMSSWVSHLPDLEFERVVGHGMNADELDQNPHLDDWFVQDLNSNPSLPVEDWTFDAVLCAVSVQYLRYPGRVFAEVRRVLRPNGVCIVSFSNRMFPMKAVRAWRVRSMAERAVLVSEYLTAAGFPDPIVISDPNRTGGKPTADTPGRDSRNASQDPFYAVVGCRPDDA